MAGAGSRFADAGYKVPKPFLDLDGKPMYQRVFENLYSAQVERVVFVTNTETIFDIQDIQNQYPNYQLLNNGYGGIIWCMEDNDPKWSYVSTADNSEVQRVVEKEVISELATVGIYCFSESKLFFDAFRLMVKDGNKTNNEYYVAPTFNYLIKNRILAKNLGPISNLVFGLGIPEDYQYFQSLPNRELIYRISQKNQT